MCQLQCLKQSFNEVYEKVLLVPATSQYFLVLASEALEKGKKT